jgi:hypothetical protein
MHISMDSLDDFEGKFYALDWSTSIFVSLNFLITYHHLHSKLLKGDSSKLWVDRGR